MFWNKNPRWEYAQFITNKEDTGVIEKLDAYGSYGWELIDVTAYIDPEHGVVKVYTFKRKV